MSDAFSSAIPGISSNATRAAVTANNIANANTSGFKARGVTVESSGSGRQKTHITKSTEPGSLLPRPDGLPEGSELEETSNVDLAEEFVQLQLSEHGYSANAAVIKTQGEMLGSLLDMLA
jgi:flagellar basal-body rod protein FlgC